MNKKFFNSLWLVCVLFLGACKKDFVFDAYQNVADIGWHKDSIVNFKIPAIDSLSTHDLFINVRNNNSYPFSNLFLITTLEFPNGKLQVDTLEYEMAYPNGEWMGTGNHIIENKLWYKEGFLFNEEGSYSLNISHAMRENGKDKGIEFLKGITDIGLRIETTKNNSK